MLHVVNPGAVGGQDGGVCVEAGVTAKGSAGDDGRHGQHRVCPQGRAHGQQNGRHHGAHADTATGFDDPAEGGGLNIVVDDARHVLLRDGFDRQAELVADGLAGVPCVGWLEGFRMRDLLLKLLRG